MGIGALDTAVLAAYFVSMAAIGIAAGLKVKDTDHYFLGRRSFGKWLMIGQSFGVGTHAEMPVSLAGAVYKMGASAIWYQWKNLFATPFYWIMAPVFRRIRRTTIGEFVEDRYGSGMGTFYILFALVFFTLNTANMLAGAGKVISQATGGEVGVPAIVVTMTVVFVVYSFVGGLTAAAWTDFFQGFLIIVLSFMLIPLGWNAVGGLGGIREALGSAKLSLATPQGITPWEIAALTLNGLVGIMAQPHMLAAVGTGKDERSCRIGFFYGNYVKRFCTVGWMLVGLVATVMVLQGKFGIAALDDSEKAFGFACRHLLFPGALGLLIASVLAANMSTCSAFMVDSGALFTQGVYRTRLAPGRSERHYVWAGRISGFLITLLGVFYALFLIDKVLYSFLLTESMATFMGIGILGGIVWRRANRWGAAASFVTALATNFLVNALRGRRLDAWDYQVFLMALAAGVAALVGVSLLTRREPKEKLDSFFGRLQTPSDPPAPDAPEEAAGTTPEPSKAVAERGQQLLLVNLLHPLKATFGLGFFRAYRADLAGFIMGWLLALALVAATAFLLRL